MASKEMEMLKVGMKMMMAQGFAPKFDAAIDPIHLRHIVQAAQEQMAAEPDVEYIHGVRLPTAIVPYSPPIEFCEELRDHEEHHRVL